MLRHFDLDRPRITIGRDPTCEIYLDNISVSRAHATVEMTDDEWVVVDQESANGTYVNGEPVRAIPLRDGDEIQVGKFAIVYSHYEGVPFVLTLGQKFAGQVGPASLVRPPEETHFYDWSKGRKGGAERETPFDESVVPSQVLARRMGAQRRSRLDQLLWVFFGVAVTAVVTLGVLIILR